MMLNVDTVRADTVGVERTIHFNNAGSSLPPTPVVDAMVDYLRAEQVSGGYETVADNLEQLDDVYTATATYLGCESDEVAFVAGAGDGWWRAFSAIDLAPGDRILASHSEYQANAFGFMQAADRGVSLEVVPNDEDGLIDVDALVDMLDERVKLVSLTHIGMANGAIQRAGEVGRAVADHQAIYLLDSCQAAGQLPLDVDDLGCDFLVYTGRKWMRGPRGTGILYARNSVLDKLGTQPFIDGRSAHWLDAGGYSLEPGARRFEYGEQHFSGKVGLGVATRYMLDVGVDAITERTQALGHMLRAGLEELPQVEVHDEGVLRGGAVCFTVRGTASIDNGLFLREQGLQISVPGRRNSQYDIGRRGIDAVYRAAPHYFNTEDEVERAIELIEGI